MAAARLTMHRSHLVNAAAVASDDPLNSAAALLKSSSFKDKSKAVDLLSAHAGEQAGLYGSIPGQPPLHG